MKHRRRAMRLPVRRKLFACSAAYLAGIYLTELYCLPACLLAVLSVLLLAMGAFCLSRRRSALFFVLVFFMLLGHWRAGYELGMVDAATQPGVRITGTISRKVSDTRVYLEAVRIEGGQTLSRPAVVTLMTEEDETGTPVYVGQRVSGTGRLFEQEAARNPGGINRRIAAICDGYDLSGYLVPGWTAEGNARFSLLELLRQAKEALSDRIASLFGEQAALFQAVMIGDRTQMDAGVVQAMRLTGIAHLLTVSGMHLSLLARALRWLLGKLRVGRRAMLLAQVVLLGGFVCLTGGAAGTVRAYIMAMIRELALRTGRRYDPLTSLGAAALLMTWIRPVWALSASFQFSFFVVLGIFLLNKQMAKLLQGERNQPALWKRLTRAAALSMSAQIAAIPMQLAFYGYIPWMALPMNLLSGMLMPALMLGGWGTLLASMVFGRAGTYLASVIGLAARILETASLAASGSRWGILRMPAPAMWCVAVFAALMICLSTQVHIARDRRRLAAALAAVLLIGYLPRFDMGTKYVQLDVGQGDGAVIRSGRHAVLVDVGPADEYAALRYLRHEGLFVDLVILSHLDEDHAGALGVLLDSEVEIDRIAMPVGAQEGEISQTVTQALERAAQAGTQIETYERGDEIVTRCAQFAVLSPPEELSGSNERSLALYADIGGMRLLTLGDLPQTCEMRDVPGCDILKVSHHGSRYATSRALIEKARPQIALISVGRNSYGHPADRVLDDLHEADADVYRTDVSGCLTVTYEAGTCSVEAYIK